MFIGGLLRRYQWNSPQQNKHLPNFFNYCLLSVSVYLILKAVWMRWHMPLVAVTLTGDTLRKQSSGAHACTWSWWPLVYIQVKVKYAFYRRSHKKGLRIDGTKAYWNKRTTYWQAAFVVYFDCVVRMITIVLIWSWRWCTSVLKWIYFFLFLSSSSFF